MKLTPTDMKTPFNIGDWLVEPATCRLSRAGKAIKLEPKVMTVLVYLAKSPNTVISREELESEAWAGMVVSYDALTNTIIKLRKAFNDNPRQPTYIETVPKKGYRLIARVSVVPGAQEMPVAEETDDTSSNAKDTPKSSKLINTYSIIGGFLAIVVFVVLIGISKNESSLQQTLPESSIGHTDRVTNTKKSIVVLPFKNLNNDPDHEYFSDGITEDLITDLSKYQGMSVIARSTAFTYKNSNLDEKQIARELDVAYLLEGSIRRDQDYMLINVQLVDAASGTNMWAERYEEVVDNLFTIQSKVRNNIASALQVKLSKQEQDSLVFRYTNSTEAYDHFLRANALYKKHSKSDNQAAREYVERAIGIDKNFARAYSLLSLTRIDEYRYNWTNSPQDSIRSAIQFAEKAVDIDPYLPQAYWILGYVHLWGTQQYDFAVKMAKKTIDIDPSFSEAYALLALLHVTMGMPEKAIEYMDTASRLNPHYPAEYPSVKGYANYWIGNYEKAREQLQDAIDRNVNRIRPNLFMVAVLHRLGLNDEVKWQVDTVLQLDPDFSVSAWAHRQAFTDPSMTEKITSDLHAAGLKD